MLIVVEIDQVAAFVAIVRGGVVLTEPGRTFLPHAEALLASMRDGIDAVRSLAQADRGAITLALVGTLASTDLTTSSSSIAAARTSAPPPARLRADAQPRGDVIGRAPDAIPDQPRPGRRDHRPPHAQGAGAALGHRGGVIGDEDGAGLSP